MESLKPEKSQDNNLEEGETLLEKIREQFKQNPHSLKLALGLIGALSTFGQNVRAGEANESLTEGASAHFDQMVQELSQSVDGHDWKGELKYFSEAGKEGQLVENFPDFPRSGSGVFKMDTVSVLSEVQADDEAEVVDGIYQQYAVMPASTIESTGDRYSVSIDLTNEEYAEVDHDELIVDALSDKIVSIQGQSVDTERSAELLQKGEGELRNTFDSSVLTKAELALASWKVDDVLSDQGEVVGYTVTFEPGVEIEVNPTEVPVE